jgi:hypothetical protein
MCRRLFKKEELQFGLPVLTTPQKHTNVEVASQFVYVTIFAIHIVG